MSRFRLIPENPRVDFVGRRYLAFALSTLVLYLPPLPRPEHAVSPPAALAGAPGGWGNEPDDVGHRERRT